MPDEKVARRSMLQNIGLVMMGAGQGATGQPFLTNYANMEADAQRAKMQRDLEQQKMEADIIGRGNYPINPSVQPQGGFDQSQMFSFGGKPYMKAPDYKSDLEKAQANYYNSLSEMMGNNPGTFSATVGSDGIPQITDTSINKPGEITQYAPEDYVKKPIVRSLRGIPQLIYQPELKPELDDAQNKAISSGANLVNYLGIVKELSQGGAKTGFFTAMNDKVPFNNAYLKQKGTDNEISMAQILKQMQSSYLSANTGAQRGFKEMTWYEPAMPTGDMPPDKIQSMVDNTVKLSEINVRNMLLSSEKQGKRLGEYRETLKELTNKYPLDKFPFGASQTKIEKELKGISSSNNTNDVKAQYNSLRQGGMSAEEAKKKLGL